MVVFAFICRFMEVGLEACLDMCLLPLNMYPKTHVACVRHLIYSHPYSLLHQFKKLMSLLKMFESISFVMYNVESILLSAGETTYKFIQCCLVDLYSWSRLLLRLASPWVLICGQIIFPYYE